MNLLFVVVPELVSAIDERINSLLVILVHGQLGVRVQPDIRRVIPLQLILFLVFLRLLRQYCIQQFVSKEYVYVEHQFADDLQILRVPIIQIVFYVRWRAGAETQHPYVLLITEVRRLHVGEERWVVGDNAAIDDQLSLVVFVYSFLGCEKAGRGT